MELNCCRRAGPRIAYGCSSDGNDCYRRHARGSRVQTGVRNFSGGRAATGGSIDAPTHSGGTRTGHCGRELCRAAEHHRCALRRNGNGNWAWGVGAYWRGPRESASGRVDHGCGEHEGREVEGFGFFRNWFAHPRTVGKNCSTPVQVRWLPAGRPLGPVQIIGITGENRKWRFEVRREIAGTTLFLTSSAVLKWNFDSFHHGTMVETYCVELNHRNIRHTSSAVLWTARIPN